MKNSVATLFFVLMAVPLLAQQTISAQSGWVSLPVALDAPPVIVWQNPVAKETTVYEPVGSVTVRVRSGGALTGWQFVVNGRELNRQPRGFKRVSGGVELTEEVPLTPGSNEIIVRAANAAGSISSEPRVIIRRPPTEQPQQVAQKRLALVVANGSYPRFPLKNPVNDGRAIRQQLEALGFVVTYRENLTLRSLKETFDAFVTDLGTHNVGLFYYAGHGLLIGGENYMQPTDADPKTESDVEFECYPLRQLVARMAAANEKGANLVFWDACRNNPYRSWYRGGGEPRTTAIQPPVGNIIVFATEPGRQAYDGDEENGLFTSELVKHIGQPNVDVFELVDRIDRGLEERGFRQPPYYEGRLRGRFVFKTD